MVLMIIKSTSKLCYYCPFYGVVLVRFVVTDIRPDDGKASDLTCNQTLYGITT